jgi:NmrA-like family protein
MRPVLEGAYGAFVVTNFWDPAQMQSETTIGTALVKAARAAGVHHLIWSTLPDCEKLSGGRFKVLHFTNKARVDAAVRPPRFRATRSSNRRCTFRISSAGCAPSRSPAAAAVGPFPWISRRG